MGLRAWWNRQPWSTESFVRGMAEGIVESERQQAAFVDAIQEEIQAGRMTRDAGRRMLAEAGFDPRFSERLDAERTSGE